MKETVSQIHKRLMNGESSSSVPTHIFDRGTGRIHDVEVHRHLQAIRKESSDFKWRKRLEALHKETESRP